MCTAITRCSSAWTSAKTPTTPSRLDPDGKRLHDAAAAQHRGQLRHCSTSSPPRPVLVVVDQPATIGALPVAVARARASGRLPARPGDAPDRRPASRRAKTDARDAYVIADAARTLPHTLRRVDVGDETLAELEVLVGFDDDLAGEATRISNRIRGLLTHIHPALERVARPAESSTRRCWSSCRAAAARPGCAKAGRRKLLRSRQARAPHG